MEEQRQQRERQAAASMVLRLQRQPQKRMRDEDDEDTYKPLRKRRVQDRSKHLTFEEFCSTYANRLKRGGQMAEVAKRQMLERFVDPQEGVDLSIVDANIERLLELYNTRNDWVVVDRINKMQ
ncbi:ORF141 [Betabaculovirus altermyunipunctae]|uniref:ORF141 n=1 Tax=Betabaculovirus altermyunipunctae TaxID=3051996 RepID=A0A1S5YEE8_9BBAC|nr:ORF141 [Betabaculovirus altermyunipunctae]AQQ80407.1 ORF141 [Betabaculovirus altermyunipunctae]